MKTIFTMIMAIILLASFTFAQDGKQTVNGTYLTVIDQSALIIAHAGVGVNSTSFGMFGSTGSVNLAGRVLHFQSSVDIYINNYRLVIGEEDSGGPGLRSLSVANEQQRIAFDGLPIN